MAHKPSQGPLKRFESAIPAQGSGFVRRSYVNVELAICASAQPDSLKRACVTLHTRLYKGGICEGDIPPHGCGLSPTAGFGRVLRPTPTGTGGTPAPNMVVFSH